MLSPYLLHNWYQPNFEDPPGAFLLEAYFASISNFQETPELRLKLPTFEGDVDHV